MAHYFKKTLRKKIITKPKLLELTISRCEKCDSEVAFDSTMSEADVNRAVEIRWPKFVCVQGLLN